MGFGKIADYYYLLFDEVSRLKREEPFLSEIVMRFAPLPKVLDLACGTGLHARFLANKGANVTAVDISEEMLNFARKQYLPKNIYFVLGDLEHLPITGGWDVILCLGNSLCLLSSRDTIRALFQHVSKLLVSGGMFLIQILNYEHPEMRQIHTRCVNKSIGDKNVTVVKTLTPSERHIFLSISYFITSEKMHEAVSEANVLQKIVKEELIRYADEVGLSVQNVFGDFQKNEFDPETSRDLIILFFKG